MRTINLKGKNAYEDALEMHENCLLTNWKIYVFQITINES